MDDCYGIKYEAEYYDDGLQVYMDDNGENYLVETYVHKNSNQVDDKTLYTILNSNSEDTSDELNVHFVSAKQFNILKQRIHEKEEGDDEDYDRFSNFNPETDVDIKETY